MVSFGDVIMAGREAMAGSGYSLQGEMYCKLSFCKALQRAQLLPSLPSCFFLRRAERDASLQAMASLGMKRSILATPRYPSMRTLLQSVPLHFRDVGQFKLFF